MRFIFFLSTCFAIGLAKVTFNLEREDLHKVFRMYPKSTEELELLKNLTGTFEIDYWTMHKIPNKPIIGLLKPEFWPGLDILLWAEQIKYDILIHNVARAVENEEMDQWLVPTPPKGQINFDKYHTFAAMQAYFDQLSVDHETIVSRTKIGETLYGREIEMVSICKDGCGNKEAIFIECGIHAREWIAPCMCLYVIDELVKVKNSALTDNVDWFIVPVSNPDGYSYSLEEGFNSRFWRKNRVFGPNCHGVNTDRNFDFDWEETSCSEDYAGPSAGSELEVQAIMKAILERQDEIKVYLAFHSYGRNILHPLGFTEEHEAQLKEAAKKAADAIAAVDGTIYDVGSTSEILYPQSGSSIDWVLGATKVNLAYAIEISEGFITGFDPQISKIQSVVQETMQGVKAFHQYVEDHYVKK